MALTTSVLHLDVIGPEHLYRIVARERDDHVGDLEFTLFDRVAYVSQIVVDERYRRQGVARALYKRLYDWAADEGAEVQHGMTTPEGAATLRALGYRENPALATPRQLKHTVQRAIPEVVEDVAEEALLNPASPQTLYHGTSRPRAQAIDWDSGEQIPIRPNPHEYTYWAACTDLFGALIHYITDGKRAKQITYKTFARSVDLASLPGGRGNPALYRISRPDNWTISFWKSKLPSGQTIYYFVWSRIEHIFTLTTPDLDRERRLLKVQGRSNPKRNPKPRVGDLVRRALK